MKYFAIINSEQRGPFTLEELAAAGVRPETYIWCKGMDDWRKARDVADVCRYWRQYLSGTLPSQLPVPQAPEQQDNALTSADEDPRHIRQVRSFDPAGPEPGLDIEQTPRSLLLPAVLVTIACFPLTGFIAIWHAYKASREWQDAKLAERDNPQLSKELKADAHDAVRSAKMWIGITFFMGMIMMALGMLQIF